MADTPDAAAVQAAIERRKQMLADSNDHDGGYPATPDGRLASILDLAVIADACEHYQRELAEWHAIHGTENASEVADALKHVRLQRDEARDKLAAALTEPTHSKGT